MFLVACSGESKNLPPVEDATFGYKEPPKDSKEVMHDAAVYDGCTTTFIYYGQAYTPFQDLDSGCPIVIKEFPIWIPPSDPSPIE